MPTIESDQPEFWTVRYAAGKTPWDLGRAPSALIRFLERAQARGKVLIPGCGSGYEVAAFHRAGYEVVALDFSPIAVRHAQNVLGDLGAKVELGDFFTHNFQLGEFDLIYERAFLCSLPPTRWREYATRMAFLLRPGGSLAGVFLYGDEPEPPPYPLTAATAHELLGGTFRLDQNQPINDSMPMFQGREYWQEWSRL